MAIRLGCLTFENLCTAGNWGSAGNLSINLIATSGSAYGPSAYIFLPTFPGGTMTGGPIHDHPIVAAAINAAQIVVAGAPVTAFVDHLGALYIIFNYDDTVLKPLADAAQVVTIANNSGYALRVSAPSSAQDALGSTAGSQLVSKQTMYRAVATAVGAALALKKVA